MSSGGGLKRHEEHLLKDLRARQQAGDAMNEDDQLMLSLLEDRYEKFLTDGLKKLRGITDESEKKGMLSKFFSRRASGAQSQQSPRNASSFDNASNVSDDAAPNGSLASEGSGVSGSPAGSMSPDMDEPSTGGSNHWTWIAKNLVCGAIPYFDGDRSRDAEPGSVLLLRAECAKRGVVISTVVSCLELHDTPPDGFVSAKDWERFFMAKAFLHVEMCEATGLPPDSFEMEDMYAVCKQLNDALNSDAGVPGFAPLVPTSTVRGASSSSPASPAASPHRAAKREPAKAAYVHCKAGRSRTWLFLMCFLMSQRDMSYDDANELLRSKRPVFSPLPAQIAFVRRFEQFLPSVHVKRVAQEERYRQILADLLQLPEEYRKRLIHDVAQLT